MNPDSSTATPEPQARVCKAPGCTRDRVAKGLCHWHYRRARKGQPLDVPNRMDVPDHCAVDGCERPYRAGGYCEMHYARVLTGIPLDAPVRASRGEFRACAVDGCERKATSRGYCDTHRGRLTSGRPLDAPIVGKTPRSGSCASPDCGHVIFARGYCARHHRELFPPAVPPPPCKVDGCGRPSKSRGYCTGHYSRARDGRTVDAPLRERTPPPSVCQSDGCDGKPKALGYCYKHYQRLKSGRPLEDQPKKPPKVCYAPDCGRRAVSRGLCNTHALRLKKHGTIGIEPVRAKVDRDLPCTVPGCTRLREYIELCGMHYSRKLSTGDVGPPHSLRRNGEGYTNQDGYRLIMVDGKYRMEHRVVMEGVIGRPLFRHEFVHHKNGQRDFNAPSNLELWAKPHPSGQRVRDLVAFVCRFYPKEAQAVLSRPRKPRTAKAPSAIQLSLIE